jgi:cell cycle arrest protein BUB3
VVYPVNSLAVHPVHDTLATAGGDGAVVVWDRHARKKLHSYAPYATSVSAAAFSRTGSKLAVSVGYDHSMGADGTGEIPPDALFVREVQPKEVQPKTKR